ncbi:MAG: HDOD domain-containing protein [Planctomycetes bacterium]|nr:HDOD domain-containing protein [Planctomycetota bacterium]
MQHTKAQVEVPDEVRAALEAIVAERRFELPLLPDVAARVIAMCNAPDTDAAAMSEVLHRDQAFAGHVLRVANSPLLGSTVPIVSLQQAVSRMGMARIAEIAVAVSVQTRVFGAGGHMALLRAMWRHSLAAACFAKEIARARRRNVEGMFLAGLLHDVGKPIVLDMIGGVERESGTRLVPGELRAALDAFHCRVGAMLSEAWKLPEPVTEAIRFHHEHQAATDHAQVAAMTCLADLMAHAVLPNALDDHGIDEQAVRGAAVIEALNLYSDDLDALFALAPDVEAAVEAAS